MTRARVARGARTLLYVAVLASLLVRLWQVRAGVFEDVRQVGAGRVALAGFCAVLGTVPAMLGWRVLLAGLGTRLGLGAAATVYFVGGLGKYLPGGFWPMLAQTDLGRRTGEPPARFALAFPVSMAVSATTGAGIGLLTVPWLTGVRGPGVAAYAAGALAVAVAAPWLVRGVLRLARAGRSRWRGSVDATVAVPDLRTIARSLALTALGWVLSGLHVAVLAMALGAGARNAMLCTAAYSLSTVAGMMAIVLPAGLGAREAVLALALGGILTGSAVLTVVALSRFLVTGADITVAALAAGCAGRSPHTPVDGDNQQRRDHAYI